MRGFIDVTRPHLRWLCGVFGLACANAPQTPSAPGTPPTESSRAESASAETPAETLLAETKRETPPPHPPAASTASTGCTAEQRERALLSLREEALKRAPDQVESLEQALEPEGPLAGYRLSHGLVVLKGSGAVALDNPAAVAPAPSLLFYAPSPTSSERDWHDFDGEDGPYRLVGWGYFTLYTSGSEPPRMPCIGKEEWLVHEAGFHTKDGGMQLTPGAPAEPPAPQREHVHFWHPRVWDLHVWLAPTGSPRVSYANPYAPEGGVTLPRGAFLRLDGGELKPVP